MGAYQFTAFYLTAGIASSLVTFLGRLGRPTGGRSLGASGAVIACFAATALRHPGASCCLRTGSYGNCYSHGAKRIGHVTYGQHACTRQPAILAFLHGALLNVHVRCCSLQMRRARSSSCP
jgi:membrane associated rhomboid family serine protease